MLVGERVTAGVDPPVPVPVRLMVTGLPTELSVMVTDPVRVPVVVGVNVTLMVQVACDHRLDGQLLVSAKSPLAAILLIVSGSLPVFVTVTVWGELVVPTCWLPKDRFVGDGMSAGPSI